MWLIIINECVNILWNEVVGLENVVNCKYILYPSMLLFWWISYWWLSDEKWVFLQCLCQLWCFLWEVQLNQLLSGLRSPTVELVNVFEYSYSSWRESNILMTLMKYLFGSLCFLWIKLSWTVHAIYAYRALWSDDPFLCTNFTGKNFGERYLGKGKNVMNWILDLVGFSRRSLM